MTEIGQSHRQQPVVAVNGRICAFGECIKGALNHAFGRPYNQPHMFVTAEYKNRILDLKLSEKVSGTRFEHAQYCPAKEFNTPDINGTVRVGVATVYERNGRILISQRHSRLRSFPNVWVVPGGHIEGEEELHDTAIRELTEEVGLSKDIKVVDILGIWESTFPQKASLGKITHHHAVCYFHAVSKAEEEIMLQNSEVQAIAWLSRAQVKDVLAGDNNSMIEVYRAIETPQTTSGQDLSWHGNRSPLAKTPELRTAKSIIENMSAGTRFALMIWLERAPFPSL